MPLTLELLKPSVKGVPGLTAFKISGVARVHNGDAGKPKSFTDLSVALKCASVGSVKIMEVGTQVNTGKMETHFTRNTGKLVDKKQEVAAGGFQH